MSNNKQSSLQQFWDKIALKLTIDQLNEFMPLFNQAKEMYKHELIGFGAKCIIQSHNKPKELPMSNNNDEELDVHSFIEPKYKTKTVKVTMSSNKKSSIELFIDQLEDIGDLRDCTSLGIIQLNIDKNEYLALKQQANAMHKEEIMNERQRIKGFLYEEICERRPYSSSKMCEEVLKFIDQMDNS